MADQRIIELPPESTPRDTEDLAIDAEDNGTRRTSISALLGIHEVKTDPHPQYLTEAEGDLRYEPIGGGGGGGGGALPPGGTTGQILAKTSSADGAASWQPLGDQPLKAEINPDPSTNVQVISHVAAWETDPSTGTSQLVARKPIDIRQDIGAQLTAAPTIQVLRLLSSNLPVRHQERIATSGYTSPGDGGGNEFYCDASDTTSADNNGSIIVDLAGRRWKQTGTQFNVRQFGAHPNATATVNTLAFQQCIDAAMTAKTGVFVPGGGIYHLTKWAAGALNVLILGYSDYSQTVGLNSATHPTTPYLEAPRYNSFSICGENMSQRSIPPDLTDILSRGSVLQFDGDMTGVCGIFAGHWERQIEIRDLVIIGTGYDVSSTGIRSPIGTSGLHLRNVTLHEWGTAVGLGDDATATDDAHADFNLLENVYIWACDTGVRWGAQNAYISTLLHCSISARVCLCNDKGVGGTKPSPKVTVIGGFIAPLTEYNGLKIEGNVAVTAGAVITVDSLLKSYKVRPPGGGTLTSVTEAATAADIKPGMIANIEGDSNINPGPPEWGVLKKVVSVSGSDVTLNANILAGVPSGARCVFGWPAIGFLGDNFVVSGTHIEATQAEDFGYGPMLFWIEGWRSESIFRGLHVNLFGVDSTWNRFVPKLYHRGVQTLHATSLCIEDSTINVTFPKLQLDDTKLIQFSRNAWANLPLTINAGGEVADQVLIQDDWYGIRYRSSGVPSGAGGTEVYWQYNGANRVRTSRVYGIGVSTERVVQTTVTRVGSGDLVQVRDAAGRLTLLSHQTADVPGLFDVAPTPGLASGVATSINLAIDSLAGLYIGRVINIAGAGTSGATLQARILDIFVNADGTSRSILISRPLVTAITNAVISPVVPVMAPAVPQLTTVGDPAATSTQFTVQGGSGASSIQNWKRTSGVTMDAAIRLGSSLIIFYNHTNSKELFTAHSDYFLIGPSTGTMPRGIPLRLTEANTPLTPPVDTAYLFLRAGSGGKSELMIKFDDGTEQQIKIQA